MAVSSFKALLFFAGGCTAAAATAHVSGVFDSYLVGPPATEVFLPTSPALSADPKIVSLQGKQPMAMAPPVSAFAETQEILLPSFDVVRVEGDGSIVIAGKAEPNAKIEIATHANVIGITIARSNGDFSIVVDEALKPGGHQLVLRSTTQDHVVTTSLETAIVSVPETESGQVLVLIEQPGEPSRLVTVPEMASSSPAAARAEQLDAAIAPRQVELSSAAQAGGSKVAVEAVEIEGRKIFLAGVANAGRKIRAYINDILLGETEASPDGRFLIEAELDLPVGDHIIHVDALEPAGVKIIAWTEVPLERQPAVAPTSPAKPDIVVSVPTSSEPATGTEIAAASEMPAPKLQNVDSAVIIRRGDTLWRISHRIYGHGARYSTIYLANEMQIRNPDRIWPGQVFKVPEKTPEGEPANMKALGKQATTTSVQ